MRNTRSTPATRAAAMMLGSGRPARPGGVVITISPTSATWAGITFINTEEGYPAVPPGTYTPARCSPRTRWPVIMPFARGSMRLCCFCRWWKARMFSAAFFKEVKNAGSQSLAISSISSRESSRRSGHQPSNFSAYSRTAWSPRVLTWRRISRTASSISWEVSPTRLFRSSTKDWQVCQSPRTVLIICSPVPFFRRWPLPAAPPKSLSPLCAALSWRR